MSKEGDQERIHLTGIHINLEEHRIEFEDSHGTLASVIFPSFGTVYFQGGTSSPSENAAPVSTESERPQTLTLSGRLATKPRQGGADRSGNPTAYARFAAHDPEQQHAHDYLATFHRHTARIALHLPRDAQITVEGYPHPSGSENRSDTFSVINILNYPVNLRSANGKNYKPTARLRHPVGLLAPKTRLLTMQGLWQPAPPVAVFSPPQNQGCRPLASRDAPCGEHKRSLGRKVV